MQKYQGHDLLTFKQERQLLRTIARRNISKQRRLAARSVLIESNIRLVFKMAQRFRVSNDDKDELHQEGFIGLMKGIDKFKHNEYPKTKLSTYVMWYIRNAMSTWLRSRNRRSKHTMEDVFENDFITNDSDPSEIVEEKEFEKFIMSKLLHLRDREKDLLVSVVMNNETKVSYAARHNCAPSLTNYIEHNAIRKLKKMCGVQE